MKVSKEVVMSLSMKDGEIGLVLGRAHGADEIGGGGTRSGDQEMVTQPAGSDRGGEGQTEIFPPDRKPPARAKGRKR